MEFIYKLYFEIYCESEFEFYDKYFSGKCDFQTILINYSLDEFLKTNPDFELRNIFLSLLIVIPLFFKKDDDKFFEFLQENFFKYDKQAQLNILSKKLEFSKIFESSEGSCDILVSQIIFKNKENSQLLSGKIEDFEKL